MVISTYTFPLLPQIGYRIIIALCMHNENGKSPMNTFFAIVFPFQSNKKRFLNSFQTIFRLCHQKCLYFDFVHGAETCAQQKMCKNNKNNISVARKSNIKISISNWFFDYWLQELENEFE